MKAKKVSVCLIALISVLAILVYPLLSDVRINDFSEKIVFGLRLCRRRKSVLEANIKGGGGK
ncbi:MAG: hypothetical protein ACI4M1_02200 [Christensenellales bacterium]